MPSPPPTQLTWRPPLSFFADFFLLLRSLFRYCAEARSPPPPSGLWISLLACRPTLPDFLVGEGFGEGGFQVQGFPPSPPFHDLAFLRFRWRLWRRRGGLAGSFEPGWGKGSAVGWCVLGLSGEGVSQRCVGANTLTRNYCHLPH